MGRIGRQRLYTGLSTLLDLIAIGLFFVQSLVGDADWIKEEFTEYQFWTSVSDLGVRNDHINRLASQMRHDFEAMKVTNPRACSNSFSMSSKRSYSSLYTASLEFRHLHRQSYVK